jgi:hypothetical protein
VIGEIMRRSILMIIIAPLFLIHECFENQSQIPNENAQSERFRILYELTDQYLSNSADPDTILFFAEETFKIAKLLNEEEYILKLYLLGRPIILQEFDDAEKF